MFYVGDYRNIASGFFREIDVALGATVHSRRMAGYLLRLFPDVYGGEDIASACSSPEFIEAVDGTTSIAVICELLAQSKLPESQVRFHARNVLLTEDAGDKAGLLALGSPLIKSDLPEIVASLNHPVSSPREKEFQEIAQNAFIGNPLFHQDQKFIPASQRGVAVMLENLALFGNLDNGSVVKLLNRALVVKSNTRDESLLNMAYSVRDSLLRRTDLPESLALAIDGSVVNNMYSQRILVDMPIHQKLVRDGVVRSSRNFLVGEDGQWVISPAAADDDFKAMLAICDRQGPQESVLRYSQCPRDVFEALSKKVSPSFLNSYPFLSESPWAAHVLCSPPADGDWLRKMQDIFHNPKLGSGTLQAFCLPSIPFQHISPSDIPKLFIDDYHESAYVVGAIRSRKFAEELGAVGKNPDKDLAILFSPHTSSRKLEQLARLNPEIAPLAACHQNGDGISLSEMSPEHQNVVSVLRDSRRLVGRATVTPAVRPASITL